MAWKGSVEVSEMNEELRYGMFLYSVSRSKPQIKPLEDWQAKKKKAGAGGFSKEPL